MIKTLYNLTHDSQKIVFFREYAREDNLIWGYSRRYTLVVYI